ncbi:hypothetical protein Lal_00005803 [Lupinus albus]|nr:hypothetical protein Lal_00005803 [Lupinus albus]
MAMANKFLVLLILTLVAISMLQIMVMASHGHGGHHYNNKKKYGSGSLKSYRGSLTRVKEKGNALHNAQGDVARLSTTNPACFSVRNVVESACVFHQGIMGIKLCALATTTGRPNKEVLSALKA